MRDRLTIPMAAKPYVAARTSFPAMAQPKFNGIRVHYDGDVAWTRTPRLHKPHIQGFLKKFVPTVPAGWILDGELMLDQRKWDFTETCSAVKGDGAHPGFLAGDMQFIIYDVNMTNHPVVPFWSRWTNLCDWYPGLLNDLKKSVFLSACYRVDDAQMVDHWLKVWVKGGYEGAIVRDMYAAYQEGSSGRALQKYKQFFDSEFEIVGVKEATGKDAGTAVFICCMPGNKADTFDVRPKGSMALRREYWTNRAELIGKMLTVRYPDKFEKTGKPQFGQGVAIRDYE